MPKKKISSSKKDPAGELDFAPTLEGFGGNAGRTMFSILAGNTKNLYKSSFVL